MPSMGQVCGQGEEGHADQPQSARLPVLAGDLTAQLPDNDGGREQLDHGV
jgi:hypothetical protein